MRQVGVRELKNEASDVIRAVREDRAEYVVTYRGRPVAVIVPISGAATPATDEAIVAARQRSRDFMARWTAAAERLGDGGGDGPTAAEMVAEQRRSL